MANSLYINNNIYLFGEIHLNCFILGTHFIHNICDNLDKYLN